MSNQTKYDAFRQTYPEFVYECYQYDVQSDGLHIVFTFRIGDSILFSPTAFVPNRPFLNFDQPKETMDTLVFNMGMIELISYWKCLCPPKVAVKCGSLSDSQIDFWKKIYFNGLGEFFYINGIHATIEDFMRIECLNDGFRILGEKGCRVLGIKQTLKPFNLQTFKPSNPQILKPLNNQAIKQSSNQTDYLVPIGGGKDSVVTLELLSDFLAGGKRPVPLIMNPRGATIGCIEAAGYSMEDVLVIHRSIHPRLLELNSQGCLNGHTPFSAMLAFYTLLASQLSGIPNIALSNESSANEATVADTGVNHQYSKSLEFENDFRSYVAENVSPQYNYFSFLRPLSELQIAMLFSRYGKYHPVFRSCNAGSKEDIWCGRCAKCLFAYIILSPFIPPQQLDNIFGKNMLDDPEMRLFFDELTGHAETKPFECVGTIDEVNTALSMAVERWYPNHRPVLLEGYTPVATQSTALTTLQPRHNLSPALVNLIQQHVQAATT